MGISFSSSESDTLSPSEATYDVDAMIGEGHTYRDKGKPQNTTYRPTESVKRACAVRPPKLALLVHAYCYTCEFLEIRSFAEY